jgi:hypothetical protein
MGAGDPRLLVNVRFWGGAAAPPCPLRNSNMHRCRRGHDYPPALFNELFEVSPIGPLARTSKVRAPSSGGIGSSHGAAIIASCASERPCAHRISIVGRSNS